LLTGENKQFDQWIAQMMEVSDQDDFNILFMKFNRIGKFVAVQPKFTWVLDNYTFYSSKTVGDWILTEFDSFFKNNKDLVKNYSGSIDTTSQSQNLTNLQLAD
jgi:hypothetical protein